MKHPTRIKGRITGITGWQMRMKDNYSNFDEWNHYCDLYGLHLKLGFKAPKAAWDANPLMQGSVAPEDFCRVFRNGTRWARTIAA
jgi:hypothetical protein